MSNVNVPKNSVLVEYTSPTVRTEDSSDFKGDHFVNCMFKHPEMFTSAKVSVVPNQNEAGDAMMNLRIHQKDFNLIHNALQQQYLQPLRENVIAVTDHSPLTFKIKPLDTSTSVTKDETDAAIDQEYVSSGAAAWNTDSMRDEKTPISFDVVITAHYV